MRFTRTKKGKGRIIRINNNDASEKKQQTPRVVFNSNFANKFHYSPLHWDKSFRKRQLSKDRFVDCSIYEITIINKYTCVFVYKGELVLVLC